MWRTFVIPYWQIEPQLTPVVRYLQRFTKNLWRWFVRRVRYGNAFYEDARGGQ